MVVESVECCRCTSAHLNTHPLFACSLPSRLVSVMGNPKDFITYCPTNFHPPTHPQAKTHIAAEAYNNSLFAVTYLPAVSTNAFEKRFNL